MVVLFVESTKSIHNDFRLLIVIATADIKIVIKALTVSLITPQRKGFEDCELHYCKVELK